MGEEKLEFKKGAHVLLLKGRYGHTTGSIGVVTKSLHSDALVVVVEGVTQTLSAHSPGVAYSLADLQVISKDHVINNYSIY
jgi:hypothetical protein